MKTRINHKTIIKFAQQAGADFSKERDEGSYQNFSLSTYTKLYHEYQSKKMLAHFKKMLREVAKEINERNQNANSRTAC
jgi:hypothetical protein